MNGKREYKVSQKDKMMCQKQAQGSVDACSLCHIPFYFS